MRLGIDFGTTHTVAAAVDRGNYPVVSFEWGDDFPSVIAARLRDGALRFGWDAVAVEDDDRWVTLRSIKRWLSGSGPQTRIAVGPHEYSITSLLDGYLQALREAILTRSNAGLRADESLEIAVGVPANAASDQRFLTLDAFRHAGFEVHAVLNEPSAAGFEYAHRFRNTITSRREYVLVYDLGGGTFDASLIHMAGAVNEVVTSIGVPHLGGDDFDEAMLDLVLDLLPALEIEGPVRQRLLLACRRQKETIGPHSRRILVDLDPAGLEPVFLKIEDVYAVCTPLVERSLSEMEQALRDPRREEVAAVAWGEIAGIYVVGGASSFPLVPRCLKERFGAHRVRRSPHPFAATAIGLATFLDEDKGYELSDCLTRHFGVWRESEAGGHVVFDPIFEKDTRLPPRGAAPLVKERRYRAAHNVGHFRFVECGAIRDGRPDGHVTPWDEIRFPFDQSLRDVTDLTGVIVDRRDAGPEVIERFECSAEGIFAVTLALPEQAFERTFTIGRSGVTCEALQPQKARPRKRKASSVA